MRKTGGFTIPELLAVVAVIGILGAIAVVGYQEYISRARSSEIILKYDAIRTSVQARAAQGKSDDCADFMKGFDSANLVDPHATLAYGFEAVSGGGYRPVLTVCAKADASNAGGAKIAKGAHDTLANIGSVEPGAVVTDSLVSFAVPLTNGKQALCQKWTAPAVTTACGAANSTQTATPAYPPPGQSTGTQAPIQTRRLATFSVSREARVAHNDATWINIFGFTSPDGSPMKIADLKVEPASFATVTGGPGNWVITIANPTVSGDGTLTLVAQNGAGFTTIATKFHSFP